MKKLLSIALATASIAACLSFVGCGGEATVNYTLSEDGTYYIVSSVSGNKNALTSYQIPATYSEQEDGEQLPVKAIGDQAFYRCAEERYHTRFGNDYRQRGFCNVCTLENRYSR